MDFKKVFDRVKHSLVGLVGLYNINTNRINVIQQLYDRSSSEVYLNDTIGDWFRKRIAKDAFTVQKVILNAPWRKKKRIGLHFYFWLLT